ncbi:50S ribosomal protein L2 [candidate division Kazan bacterium RIFCSPHIGHO2_01_FULL_49_10]|uniref:Large ribosomal subunit protein uL2 n=1 Tax=candidate division Kazan bacterium RIFCSPLOWO2_01_FULL_48_13 TaxID=1798539 RepID=A0A1F4PPZ3_UNCK3|nr:MAG: 50S ribosomal protein L2 [candidate division Kazan bacterium RIFCSPHIGHO2_01_FULL_49_10]OGB85656.1 MAG: 50S ribosomal protein L2 [candidate division Kazan bacterium RIFCSPLOWO2_01_FULL_48_13]
MTVKKLKPITAGRRNMSQVVRTGVLTETKPLKSLTWGMKRRSGRNSRGVITVQHRGGGAKRRMRYVDLKQTKLGIPGTIKSIEYDPGRSAYIALVNFLDGEKTYILAPVDIKVNDRVVYNVNTKIKTGNRLMLKNIPTGTVIHNIELQPGRGGQMVRSAGGSASVIGFDKGYAQVRVPSGEVRMIPEICFASIGALSNPDHSNIKIGKAGRKRWMGRRPIVRGKAKNPVDHPHGGGEGGSPIGLKHPKTPTGKPTKGYKTRKKNKPNWYIIKPRTKKRRK